MYRRRNRGRSDCPRRVSCNGGWNVDTSPRGNDRCQCAAQACEHFYIVTEPLDGAERGMPIVRDPNNYTYFKEETGKIMAGFFELQSKIWNLDGIPRDFCFGTLPEDWDHIRPIFEAACHRMPSLADAGLQLFFNGPEAFTPDGTFYLGEAPEVDRCFVAAGFNSVGIQTAGGRLGYGRLDRRRASPYGPIRG